MSVCLCNLSADKALELVAQHELEVGPATPDLDSFSGDVALAKEALGDVFDRLPKPVDLLVGSAKERRRASGVACHVWMGALPKNGVLSLGEDVYENASRGEGSFTITRCWAENNKSPVNEGPRYACFVIVNASFDGRRSQSLKLGPIVRTIRIFTRNCALIASDIVQQ